jgi:catechol 2,3-dioxygenase-like lactoylglutathione lyase family enzyme
MTACSGGSAIGAWTALTPARPAGASPTAPGGFFTIALKAAHPERRTAAHDRHAPGLHHLAFHADSRADVDDFHFVVGIGATVLDPPAEYDYTPGYYAVFFADPDGIKLEVVFEPELRGRADR